MTRVLLVHHTFPGIPGGVELVVGQQAVALREAGVEVAVLAGRGPHPVSGVESIRVPLVDARHPSIAAVQRELAVGRVPVLFDVLRTTLGRILAPHVAAAHRVVLHNVASLAMDLPLLAALHDLAPTVPPGRLVVWVHDLAATDPLHAAALHPGEPWDLARRPLPGARYVAVSEVRRSEVAATLGIPTVEIDVVPNGVDVADVVAVGPATTRLLGLLGLREADPLLVLPARLTPRKRIELAIDAVAHLRNRRPTARLVVTGAADPHPVAGSDYVAELERRAEASGGAAVLAVTRLGHELPRRQLTEVLRVADALVFPSDREGFGIPLLEAAVLRLPIVCTDLPVLREIAGADATYLPREAGADAWAEAIEVAVDGQPVVRLARRVRSVYDLRRVLAERAVPAILR